MHPHLRTTIAVLFAFALCAAHTTVHAQRTSGAVGLGGQLGDPTGVTLKIHNANTPSYDFLAAWDLDDFFFLNAHALFENDIDTEDFDPDLNWFIGPGGFVGFFDGPVEEEARFGVSGTIGLNLVFNRRVELYARFTPRINLLPNTDGDVGGGLGVRYYF